MRHLLLAGIALVGLSANADAALITQASLFTPLPMPGIQTTIGLQGAATPSQATIFGAGYTISFSTDASQGVVQGASGVHAIPVAGVSHGKPTYLTGDYGSSQTVGAGASGNYFSTGLGSITITFAAPQTSLALLWGSIDFSNAITFNNASGDTLTGAMVQSLAAGFVGNGFQGAGGSAYVTTVSDTPFTTATLSSGVISFESAGYIASAAPVRVPEPASIAVFGMGLLGMGLIRRRRQG